MLSQSFKRVVNFIRERRGFVCERPVLLKAIETIESASMNKNNLDSEVYLIKAPTGYGKTLLSMSIGLNEFLRDSKVIVAYPLRSLIEEQLTSFKSLFKFYGHEKRYVGARYMGYHESPYLIHPVTLTTIDTLSLTALGLSPEDIARVYSSTTGGSFVNLGHYLFAWSSIFLSSFIILDEAHMMYDSSKSLNFLKALLDLCKSTGVNVVLMTATFPKSFENVLPKNARKIVFDKQTDPDFYKERSDKKYEIDLLYLKSSEKLERIIDILSKHEFKKALVLFNTVEDAVSLYKRVNGNKIIIHSRFSPKDKKVKISRLNELKYSDEKCIIVGTQAVEAGVDLSSDLIITELSPPISLVQRFGRFLRYNEKTGKAFVWIEEEVLDDSSSDRYKVYDKNLVRRTLDYLESNRDLNLHISYDEFVDYIYQEPPRLNNNLISKLRSVLLNLVNPSGSAMDLFLELEGSFVREGSNFIVVCENGVEVNVSYEYLMKLKREGRCVNCPRNQLDALRRSLAGEKFKIRASYDEEVGLV